MKTDVTNAQISLGKPYALKTPIFNCSEEFQKLALQLMSRENLNFPTNAVEGRTLYNCLTDLINNL